MNKALIASAIVVSLFSSSLAQFDAEERAEFSFQPRVVTILGADTADTPLPFTRVFTQQAGELSIRHIRERYVNFGPYWEKLIRGWIENEMALIGTMTITWGGEFLRVECLMDRSRSNPFAGKMVVILEVVEGSTFPAGTILGEAVALLTTENGDSVMTVELEVEPGIFPEILPTGLIVADLVNPDMMRVPRRGAFVAEYEFTSVAPPDGSSPLTHTVTEKKWIGRGRSRDR